MPRNSFQMIEIKTFGNLDWENILRKVRTTRENQETWEFKEFVRNKQEAWISMEYGLNVLGNV